MKTFFQYGIIFGSILFFSSCKPSTTPPPQEISPNIQGEMLYSTNAFQKKKKEKEPHSVENNVKVPETVPKIVSETVAKIDHSTHKKYSTEKVNENFSKNTTIGKEYQEIDLKFISDYDAEYLGAYSQDATKKKKLEIPEKVQKLHGKKVVIEGYMLPIKYHKGFTKKFLILGMQVGCCYGEPPRINEVIVVTMDKDQSTPLIPDYIPCRVSGIFEIEQKKDEDARFEGLYYLKASNVEKVSPILFSDSPDVK